MKRTIYNKLVRDRIPEIIDKSGKQAKVEKLEDLEYKDHLDKKLGEELQEYLDSDSIEELADIIEVIYAIAKYKGVTIQELEAIRSQKAEARGGFDKRLLLKEVIEE